MIYEFLIDDSNQNTRLDVFLANEMELSRSEIQKFIEDKKVLVNDKAQKKNYKLNSNDKIKFDYEKEDKIVNLTPQSYKASTTSKLIAVSESHIPFDFLLKYFSKLYKPHFISTLISSFLAKGKII